MGTFHTFTTELIRDKDKAHKIKECFDKYVEANGGLEYHSIEDGSDTCWITGVIKTSGEPIPSI